MNDPELLFVYNADSGLINAVFDSLHKAFSPSTYQCQLCAITYGHFSMNSKWKDFIESLPVKSRFLYRNEWLKEFDQDEELPAIFAHSKNQLSPIVSAQDFHNLSLEELMEKISDAL